MTKVVAYARGEAGSRGSQDALAFQRRIRLPFETLDLWGGCQSFQVHVLGEEEELSEGMLMGPEMVLFQNFVPASDQEAILLLQVAHRLQWSGKAALWWYDLEDPELLKDQRVLDLLPLMRVVTVPNTYLEKELANFSRISLQHIAVLPSTYNLATFQKALSLAPQQGQQLVLGCLGPHDWASFLSGFIKALQAGMSSQDLSRLHVVTDTLEVLDFFAPLSISGTMFGHSGDLRSMFYPLILARCSVGLLPREGKDGRDSCWQWEYGAMGVPTLAARGSAYETPKGNQGHLFLPFDDPDAWVKELLPFLGEGGQQYHHALGYLAFEEAQAQRVTLATREYATLFRQLLPMFRSRS